MPVRPYIQDSVVQLDAHYESNIKNISVLLKLRDELTHRKKPKAIALLAKVDETIKQHTSKNNPPSQSTTKASEQSQLKVCPAVTPPSCPTAESTSKSNDSSAQPDLFGFKRTSSTQNTAKSTTKDNSEESSSGSRKGEKTTESEDTQHRNGRRGVMRARGKLADVPEKRIFKQKDDISLNLPKDAELIKRYEASLKALITDMRKNNASSRQIALENGQSVSLDGKENGYQFPFEEDAELFEGAAVVASVGGMKSEGQIIGIIGRQILISLADDFGPHISFCIIKVDNTAMLEALRSRLEKIIKGEVSGFNTKLAEAVMRNEGDELPLAIIPSAIANTLNAQQKKAIALALSNEVLYIWGPPGTGKTQTLSALCLALHEGEKRLLICSNTNQAVDQVLLKLCTEFNCSASGRKALDDGGIVRIGKIVSAQLNEKWSPYVTLDGIVERKSASLRMRKVTLEEELEKINRIFERTMEIFQQFKRLDELVEREEIARKDYERILNPRSEAIKQIQIKQDVLNAIDADIRRYSLANIFMKTVLTKPEILEQKKAPIQAEIERLNRIVESNGHASKEAKQRLDEIAQAVQKAREALAGFNHDAVEKKIEEAEKQKQPILEEITDINKQLDDIRKAITDNAKIVGATVTKAYLSPQMFNSFDVVIVDEASMVLLPAMYHAAGLAKEKVIVSGDFRQLAPIVTTNQKAILDEIGSDVFHAAKLESVKTNIKRRVMLDEQYRMDVSICKLISKLMYDGKLKTGQWSNTKPTPAAPFSGILTIVDTSPIYPFVNRDSFGSRFNLLNALAIRNLCLYLKDGGYLVDSTRVGVCTPYSAQTKVMKRILSEYELAEIVESGTVHRFQGDEKNVIVLDIPDSVGESRVGVFLEADSPSENGAMLFNVAVSRAQSHLIVFANIDYLDKKLPEYSILRDILFNMQNSGTVIDVRDVLSLYPVMNDLRKYGSQFDLSPETLKTGLFGQSDFDVVCRSDMERATKGVAIFSGFITPQRVGSYESLFRSKRASGVPIRCVTRPPLRNGSIPVDQGKDALDGLESMGCVVDTRGDIHEKLVIIDDEIVWFGSLNPLSHTSKTAEVMARFEGKQLVKQLVAFMALDKGVKPDNSDGVVYCAENPRCPLCEGRTSYKKGKFGAYWDCEAEECTWKESYDKPKGGNGRGTAGTGNFTDSKCPECGKALAERMGRFGVFIACTGYPACKYIEKKKSEKKKSKKS